MFGMTKVLRVVVDAAHERLVNALENNIGHFLILSSRLHGRPKEASTFSFTFFLVGAVMTCHVHTVDVDCSALLTFLPSSVSLIFQAGRKTIIVGCVSFLVRLHCKLPHPSGHESTVSTQISGRTPSYMSTPGSGGSRQRRERRALPPQKKKKKKEREREREREREKKKHVDLVHDELKRDPYEDTDVEV